jgi:hypothetical protein
MTVINRDSIDTEDDDWGLSELTTNCDTPVHGANYWPDASSIE